MIDTLSEFDKSGLHLKILHDLANSGAYCAKKGRYLKAFEPGIGENYVNSRLELEFSVTSRSEGENFQFILSRDALFATIYAAPAKPGIEVQISDGDIICLYARAEGEPVFMRPGNISQSSEHVVSTYPFPGGIWRVTFQNWMKCGWYVFAGVASDCDIEIIRTSAEREMAISLKRAVHQMRGGASSLVKSVPDVLDDVVSYASNSRRKALEDNLNVCLSGLVIEFFDHSCRVRLEEALNNEFQLRKLIVRPTY